jgi:hypothetical protein
MPSETCWPGEREGEREGRRDRDREIGQDCVGYVRVTLRAGRDPKVVIAPAAERAGTTAGWSYGLAPCPPPLRRDDNATHRPDRP